MAEILGVGGGACLASGLGVVPASRLLCALLVSALTACGGKSVDTEGGPSGGSNQGGDGQAGGFASAGKGGGALGGSGQGGAGSVCSDVELDVADDFPAHVQVAIINKTSAPVYLGQEMMNCSVDPLFRVDYTAGAPLPRPDNCGGSCQVILDGGPWACPPVPCALPSASMLQPGETLFTSWDGLYQVQRELPARCLPAGYDGSCQQIKQVNAGNFTFSAVGARDIDCMATTGAACGVCSPSSDGAGGCTTRGALIAGKMLKAVTSVQLDYRYGVYGGPAPLPLPMPAGGSSNSGNAVALLTVELVFTE